jgi:hypothetical protein
MPRPREKEKASALRAKDKAKIVYRLKPVPPF